MACFFFFTPVIHTLSLSGTKRLDSERERGGFLDLKTSDKIFKLGQFLRKKAQLSPVIVIIEVIC